MDEPDAPGSTASPPPGEDRVVCSRCAGASPAEAVECETCGAPLPAGFGVLAPLERPVLVVGERPAHVPPGRGARVAARPRLRRLGSAFVLASFAGGCAALALQQTATPLRWGAWAAGALFAAAALLALRPVRGANGDEHGRGPGEDSAG